MQKDFVGKEFVRRFATDDIKNFKLTANIPFFLK